MDSHTPTRLQKETATFKIFLIVFSLVTLSGYLTYFTPEQTQAWRYYNILGHLVLGLVFLYPLVTYTVAHAIRVLGIRKPLSLTMGFTISLALFGLATSGLYLAWNGLTQTSGWIAEAHIWIAHGVVILTLLHTIAAVLKNLSIKQSETVLGFKSLTNTHLKWLALCIGAYPIILFGLQFGYEYTAEHQDSNIVENYQYSYGNHPFLPSQTETPNRQFVNYNQIAVSRNCGTCHKQIYEQWSSSAHRQAASDPAYVKNINLLAENQGMAATRYCEGCHAPVALLTGQLSEGGNHGGISGTDAFHEGVGCLGCHGISEATHLNGTASYLFSPESNYLFEHSESTFGRKIYNLLIRLHPSEHKTAMRKPILEKPELCATCHEQFMDKTMNNWGWVKLQNVYSDWLSSPYSGQSEKGFQNASIRRCQDCHFPLEELEDPSADEKGLVSAHWAPGANTMLPYLNGDTKHLNRIKQFLQNNIMNVSIDSPTRKDIAQSKQFVNQKLQPSASDNSPYFLYLGETAKLRITVSNRGVGHSFPIGTTDINQAWMNFHVTDASGEVIFESGGISESGQVDSSAHFYHSIPVDRTGKAVWKHDLFRMTGETYKNVIAAGDTDIVDYQFSVPYWAKSPLTVSATLRYRKFNQRYANWALGKDHPALPITDLSYDTKSIPLIKQKPINTQ